MAKRIPLPAKLCPICEQTFQPRKRNQVYCSVLCRNRFAGRHPGGNRPNSDLTEQACIVCGITYTPVRESQRACSRRCRDDLPDRVAASRAQDARPERREYRNVARRVAVNPDRRAINLRNNIRRYGLTVEAWQAMVEQQNGVCAICGDPPKPGSGPSTKRLHIDHDHTTGKNRKLLCLNCNRGLGYFKDDPALLRAAADYIDRHRQATP